MDEDALIEAVVRLRCSDPSLTAKQLHAALEGAEVEGEGSPSLAQVKRAASKAAKRGLVSTPSAAPKEDESARATQEGAAQYEPGWRDGEGWEKLSAEQRADLKRHHERWGTTAWPVAGLEVPEMLVPGMISSLRVHPNQRFKVSVEALPSFRMYQPGATVHGQVFPTGRQAALLREDYGEVSQRALPPHVAADPDSCAPEVYDQYLCEVPTHLPIRTVFAVFGEVVWTKSCLRGLKDFYDHGGSGGNGARFAWPGGDACGICPGTGKRIEPDGKTRHLLLACEMAGVANGPRSRAFAEIISPRLHLREYISELLLSYAEMSAGFASRRGGLMTAGTFLHRYRRGDEPCLLYRIIPRVLTREGYEVLMGGPSSQGAHRCQCVRAAFDEGAGSSGEARSVHRPLYVPEGGARKGFTGVLKELAPWGGDAPPAEAAWGCIHADGTYLAIERLFEDDRKRGAAIHNEATRADSSAAQRGVIGRSSGPSTYEPAPLPGGGIPVPPSSVVSPPTVQVGDGGGMQVRSRKYVDPSAGLATGRLASAEVTE